MSSHRAAWREFRIETAALLSAASGGVITGAKMALSRKLQGHYAYYGITGNAAALIRFRYEVERRWRKWLSRRSRKARLNWAQFDRLRHRYPLPPARVVHSIYRGAATS